MTFVENSLSQRSPSYLHAARNLHFSPILPAVKFQDVNTSGSADILEVRFLFLFQANRKLIEFCPSTFRTDEQLSASIVALQATHIFNGTLNIISPADITILDSDNQQVSTFFGNAGLVDFPSRFKIQPSHPHCHHRKQSRSWIIFQIQSSLALSVIRRDATVSSLLTKANARLSLYTWPPTIQDVVLLGVRGFLPGFCVVSES
jgi:hypothetical protein